MNRFLFPWLGYLPMLDADAGGGLGGDAGQGDGSNSGDAGDGDDASGKGYRTQAEFDKAFEQRLARERRKIQAELEAKIKADADKAKMDEAERLKAEKAELETQLQSERAAIARERVRTRAESLAVKVGGRGDRAEHIAAQADLSDIEPDKQGKIDNEAISKALKAVLEIFPEWKADAGASRSGGAFHGQSGYQGKNPWAKATFNLTEQARILKENPGLATQLREAAKG